MERVCCWRSDASLRHRFTTTVSGIPFMLVALLVGAVVANAMRLLAGIELGVVGAVPASLPPLSAPDLRLDTLRDLAPAVVAVTMFALAEAVSISRSLAARSGNLSTVIKSSLGRDYQTSLEVSSLLTWRQVHSTVRE